MDGLVTTTINGFRRRLRSIIRRYSGDWRGAEGLAAELSELIHELEGVEPDVGLAVMAEFYRHDGDIIEGTDDSNGALGDLFRHEAQPLFQEFAAGYKEKDRLTDLMEELCSQNDYGLRDTLLDGAAHFLPESCLRELVARFQGHHDRSAYIWVETLALELKDPELFKETRLGAWGSGASNPAACLDIARAYLAVDDLQSARSWLERVSEDGHFKQDEVQQLSFEVLGRLGESDRQRELAWKLFRRSRGRDRWEQLLVVEGEHRREAILEDEWRLILQQEKLALSDALFLMEVERFAELEEYLLQRAAQLDGDRYYHLIPLAEELEAHGRPLAASLCYRSLLDSILKRGRSKAYHHAVRYLRTLDMLASLVSDWRCIPTHSEYFQTLREVHGRKSSFWSGYTRR